MNTNIELVNKMEALLAQLKASLESTSPMGTRTDKKVTTTALAFSGLTAEIYGLIQEGFFKEPRTISEIQNKLKLEGVNKPTTSLMKPLLLLVKKKVIGRSEDADGKGPYKYHQR